MGELFLTVYRGANAPAIVMQVGDDIDLTGSIIEMEVVGAFMRMTLSSADGDLVVDAGAGTITWAYSAAQSAAIPGVPAQFDLWRVLGPTREKLGAGTIQSVGFGRAPLEPGVTNIKVPGIQGPAGDITEAVAAATAAVAVPAAAAVDAAEAAGEQAVIAATKADEATADRAAVAADREAVATDRDLTSTYAAAAATSAKTFTSLAALNADLAHAAGVTAQVISGSSEDGLYLKAGVSGSGSWSKISGSTVPGLAADLALRGEALDARKYELAGWIRFQVDSNGRLIEGIDENLDFWVGHKCLTSPREVILGGATVEYLSADRYELSGYVQAAVDSVGRILGGIPDAKLAAWEAEAAGADEVSDYIVYEDADSSANRQIYSASKTTGKVVRLSTPGSNNTVPQLLDGGDKVSFRSDRSGGSVGNLYYSTVSAAREKPLIGYRRVVAWGDSITFKSGVPANSYWYKLGALLGWPAAGFGVNGQDSTQIGARQGGVPFLVTVAGNQIPASGPVTITARSASPITSGLPNLKLHVTLVGIAGLIERDGSDVYTFTRDGSGSATACPPRSLAVPDASGTTAGSLVSHDLDGLTIFGVGRNQYHQADQIVADIKAMRAYLGPLAPRWLVPSILNGDGEGVGTAAYASIMRTNARLLAEFPDNFVDVRAALIAGYNASLPQDVTDHNNDLVPTSLRETGDFLHPNNAGHDIMAATLRAAVLAKGWN